MFITKVMAAACLVLLAGSCGQDTVASEDLAFVVGRDGVPFDSSRVPAGVAAELAQADVIIIGETHLVHEQRDLTVSLVKELHAHGVRLLLLEWPHNADWLMADFVLDGPLSQGWQPPKWFYGDIAAEIRDFNRGLPERDRIQVRAIDANLDAYGGAAEFIASLTNLSSRLPDRQPLLPLLSVTADDSEEYARALSNAVGTLRSNRTDLEPGWGAARYFTVVEMIEV